MTLCTAALSSPDITLIVIWALCALPGMAIVFWLIIQENTYGLDPLSFWLGVIMAGLLLGPIIVAGSLVVKIYAWFKKPREDLSNSDA
jgi:hypothetical protein